MTAKEVDKRMPEPCTNVYRGWDDLGVLNELQQSHCVVDFKPGAARILWANAFYLKEHGLTESSVVAAKLPTRGDGADDTFHAEIHEVVQLEQRTFETKERRPGGRAVLLRCRPVQILLLHEGRAMKVLALVSSVPVESPSDDLDEQFYAAIAHELKAPLNGVIAPASSLLLDPAVSKDVRKTLKLIKSSGQRLSSLISDIIDSASAKRSPFRVKNEQVDLNELAEVVCDSLAPFAKKHVQLINNVADMPMLQGDSARINQMLTNLLSNAIKCTDSGTVAISAKLMEKGRKVLVEVSDNGRGIPEEELKQVWEPFNQTRNSKLEGLSLSLVRLLVEAHHGQVGVRSQCGGDNAGSTFYFTLPLRQPMQTSSSGTAKQGREGESAEVWLTPRQARAGLASTNGGGHDAEDGEVQKLTAEVSALRGRLKQLQDAKALADQAAQEQAASKDGRATASALAMSGGSFGKVTFEGRTMRRGSSVEADKGSSEGEDAFGDKLKRMWSEDVQRLVCSRPAVLQIPENVQERIRGGDKAVMDRFESVVVMICEVVDMRRYVERMNPADYTEMLNGIFDAFDLVAQHEMTTRIVDDSYMIVIGDGQPSNDAESVSAAMSIVHALFTGTEGVHVTVNGKDEPLRLRVGLARGEVFSGLVGVKTPHFTFFGEAVRAANEAVEKAWPQCAVATASVREAMEPENQEEWVEYDIEGTRTAGRGLYLFKDGDFEQALAATQRLSPDRKPPSHFASPTPAPASDAQQCHVLYGATSHMRGLLPWSLSIQQGWDSRAHTQGGIHPAQQPSWGRKHGSFRTDHSNSFRIAQRKELRRESSGNASLQSRSRRSSDMGSVAESAQSKGSADSYEFCECAQCTEWISKYHVLQQELDRLKSRNTQKNMTEFGWGTAPALGGNSRETGAISVLSVDDDPVNQMVIETLLEPVGYQVHACMDGTEALDFLKTCASPPDLVLLDVMMPVMSGYECCQKIRETYTRSALPIIMVSAKSASEDVVEGLEAGCNDYVSKPFNRLELLARISTQLRVKDAWREEVEHAKSTQLLRRMLPDHVIAKLKQNGSFIVEEHEDLSILFCNVVGFKSIGASLPTMELVLMLNQMFNAFDDICEKHGCLKLDAIGDTYIAVAGHDETIDRHAAVLVRMGIDMVDAIKKIQYPRNPGRHMQIRVGIHSGAAYSGVVGTKTPRYCFFGDTVNTAASLELAGFAMSLHVSQQTKEKLAEEQSDFQLESLGEQSIKGKGQIETFVVKHPACAWKGALAKAASMQMDHMARSETHSKEASFSTDFGGSRVSSDCSVGGSFQLKADHAPESFGRPTAEGDTNQRGNQHGESFQRRSSFNFTERRKSTLLPPPSAEEGSQGLAAPEQAEARGSSLPWLSTPKCAACAVLGEREKGLVAALQHLQAQNEELQRASVLKNVEADHQPSTSNGSAAQRPVGQLEQVLIQHLLERERLHQQRDRMYFTLLADLAKTRGATVPPVHAPTTSLASTGPVGDKASVAAEEQSAAREREGLL